MKESNKRKFKGIKIKTPQHQNWMLELEVMEEKTGFKPKRVIIAWFFAWVLLILYFVLEVL